jgi:alpha-L-fucosidase
MDVNGESIYGTQGSPFGTLPWGRCTQKPGKLYLHVFDGPKDGSLVLPKMNKRIDKAYLLADATKKALPISETEKGPAITLPTQLPDAIDSVIVVEIQGDTPHKVAVKSRD